jgi:DNA-binding Xre family transcriptional regulator
MGDILKKAVIMINELKTKPRIVLAIGNNIKKFLDDREETISQLAKETHISYTTVLDLYHGKTTQIKFDTLEKLCNYFGVGPCELFPYSPEKKRR